MNGATLPLLALLSTAAAASTAAQQSPAAGPPPVRAVFAIIDSAGARAGQVTAVQNPDGVLLQVFATGLTPGSHGLHLHASAACEPPGFQSAGIHFNPEGRQHGTRNPAGPHAGDLANLVANDKGEARAQVVIPGVTLTPGEHSIGAPGSALVIHAMADDELTDPTGNSGARIGCAVLSIATP
ncbi:MAG: superoxide dismutase family protein [Gemmatimonadota bacterium]